MSKKFLDWATAAELLEVSVRQLRRFVHDQGAPVVYVGTRIRFDGAALQAWRDANLTVRSVGWSLRKLRYGRAPRPRA